MSAETRVVPTMIHNPAIVFVSFEAADQASSILKDWLKEPTDANVVARVLEVTDALDALMGDADVIMIRDN